MEDKVKNKEEIANAIFTSSFSDVAIETMEHAFTLTIKGTEDEEIAEEVLENVEKEISRLQNPQIKAIIANMIIAKQPVGIQKTMLEGHTKLLDSELFRITLQHMPKEDLVNVLQGCAEEFKKNKSNIDLN